MSDKSKVGVPGVAGAAGAWKRFDGDDYQHVLQGFAEEFSNIQEPNRKRKAEAASIIRTFSYPSHTRWSRRCFRV
jgi:hypothetical protein